MPCSSGRFGASLPPPPGPISAIVPGRRRRRRRAGTRSGPGRLRRRARRARARVLVAPAATGGSRRQAGGSGSAAGPGRRGRRGDAGSRRGRDAARRELLACAGDTGSPRRRWRARTAARGRRPTPRPRRWPTVKSWWPRWLAEDAARAVDDLPWRSLEPAVAREERALALAGEEAEVLALGLAGDLEAGRGRDLAHLAACVSSASGKRSRASDAGRRPGEHVGLVLGRVGGGAPAAGPRRRRRPARSGRWRAPRSRAGRRARSSRRCAARRCSPRMGSGSARRGSRRGRRRPPARAKLRLEVESQVRDPEPMRERARAEHRLGEQQLRSASVRRSAQSFSVTGDDLGAALALEQRGDRGVDAAAERDQNALAAGRRRRELSPTGERRRGPGAGRRRRARPRGGPAGRRLRAPRRLAPGRSAPRRAPSAPSTSSAAAAAAARAAAQPSASKLTCGDRPAVDLERDRTRSPQGAPPAAPSKPPATAARAGWGRRVVLYDASASMRSAGAAAPAGQG